MSHGRRVDQYSYDLQAHGLASARGIGYADAYANSYPKRLSNSNSYSELKVRQLVRPSLELSLAVRPYQFGLHVQSPVLCHVRISFQPASSLNAIMRHDGEFMAGGNMIPRR